VVGYMILTSFLCTNHNYYIGDQILQQAELHVEIWEENSKLCSFILIHTYTNFYVAYVINYCIDGSS